LYEHLRLENEQLYLTGQKNLVDALSYEQPVVDLSAFGIAGNCIGFINLPSIDVELPIYLGANEENMRRGAVHLTQTSYPIGGNNTNSVIAAHRGYVVLMFRNIHRMQIDDEVIITNFQERLVYRVVDIMIIAPTDVNEILIQPGRDLVTLVSCHPLGANYQRFVVVAERADPILFL
jgi:sortase A